jgi:hypothetical protein
MTQHEDEDEVVMLMPHASLTRCFSPIDARSPEKVYRSRCRPGGKGIPLVNVLALAADERDRGHSASGLYQARLACSQPDGKVKRVNMQEFADVRPSALIAMTLERGIRWAGPGPPARTT